MTVHTERFGTRHRAALGITEQTDAVVIVVSEENGQISLVERARIVRNLNEPQLARAVRSLLAPSDGRGPFGRRQEGEAGAGGRAPRLSRSVTAGPASPLRLVERRSRRTPWSVPTMTAPRPRRPTSRGEASRRPHHP